MKVGSLVGYVKHNPADVDLIQPKKSTIYTVRAFFKKGTIYKRSKHGSIFAPEDLVFVEEIVNKEEYFNIAGVWAENAYCASSFRELQSPIANIEEHINENTLEPVYI